MVASVDCSRGLVEELNRGALLGPQPWDSDSELSSLGMDRLASLALEFPCSEGAAISRWSLALLFLEADSELLLLLFNGDPERVLSSDDELDNSSISAVFPLGPRSINCLGTTALPTSCFNSLDFFSPIFNFKKVVLLFVYSLQILI